MTALLLVFVIVGGVLGVISWLFYIVFSICSLYLIGWNRKKTHHMLIYNILHKLTEIPRDNSLFGSQISKLPLCLIFLLAAAISLPLSDNIDDESHWWMVDWSVFVRSTPVRQSSVILFVFVSTHHSMHVDFRRYSPCSSSHKDHPISHHSSNNCLIDKVDLF